MDKIAPERISINSITIESSGDYFYGALNLQDSNVQYGNMVESNNFVLVVIITFDSDNIEGNFKFKGEINMSYLLPTRENLDVGHIYSCTLNSYYHFQNAINALFAHRIKKPTIKIVPLKNLKNNINKLLR